MRRRFYSEGVSTLLGKTSNSKNANFSINFLSALLPTEHENSNTESSFFIDPLNSSPLSKSFCLIRCLSLSCSGQLFASHTHKHLFSSILVVVFTRLFCDADLPLNLVVLLVMSRAKK